MPLSVEPPSLVQKPRKRTTSPARGPINLLLFAAVPDREMLDQGFYAAEADGLRAESNVHSVRVTNEFGDVRRANVDGIVSYFYSHSAAVGLIARARQIPVVATGGCEQLVRDSATPVLTYASRVAAFHVCTVAINRLLATSTEDFDRMQRVAIVGHQRIERSFHGVPAVERADPSHFTLTRTPASMVTIAGLDSELNVRRKGVLDAVHLLARFQTQGRSASLTIIGRTTCHEMVAAHARALGVEQHISFAGYVTEEEKLALLHRAQYYVQLSDYEGFGIGALEALAHGCQVIHTNVGGLRDTIGDYGYVLRREDIATFDPRSIPPYIAPEWSQFSAHLAQFRVDHRAATVLKALGLSQSAPDKILAQSVGNP